MQAIYTIVMHPLVAGSIPAALTNYPQKCGFILFNWQSGQPDRLRDRSSPDIDLACFPQPFLDKETEMGSVFGEGSDS